MAGGTDCNSYDGVLDNLPTSLQESIKNIIKEEGYKRHKVEKKTIPQTSNFTSILYEVDITGETVDGEKITSLFIKKAVTLDKITIAKMSDMYSLELFVYNDLFRVFRGLQDAANVPEKERFSFLKMYKGNTDCIIMENLSRKGFKTYDKTEVIPLKFGELSIIRLAKFHAISYVIKKEIPKYFEDKIKVIRSPYTINSDMEGFMHNICAVAAEVLEGEVKAKISNYAERLMQTYCKYVHDDVPSNGCLCHGDYKFPNIMVKERDEEPLEVQPIDYQLAYYGNPVNDFLFFIYTCTNRDFRKKHLNYLKDLYFEHFAKFLSYFNMEVSSTYSREEFESDYKERLELGLVYGLHVSVFTFAHIGEGFDVTTMSLSELRIVPDEMFADHIRSIVEDFVDWGYL